MHCICINPAWLSLIRIFLTTLNLLTTPSFPVTTPSCAPYNRVYIKSALGVLELNDSTSSSEDSWSPKLLVLFVLLPLLSVL